MMSYSYIARICKKEGEKMVNYLEKIEELRLNLASQLDVEEIEAIVNSINRFVTNNNHLENDEIEEKRLNVIISIALENFHV